MRFDIKEGLAIAGRRIAKSSGTIAVGAGTAAAAWFLKNDAEAVGLAFSSVVPVASALLRERRSKLDKAGEYTWLTGNAAWLTGGDIGFLAPILFVAATPFLTRRWIEKRDKADRGMQMLDDGGGGIE